MKNTAFVTSEKGCALYGLSRMLTCLVAALSFLTAVSASAQNARPSTGADRAKLQAQQEAEQAIGQGRFLELKGLTNSTDDQIKVVQICSHYHGADSRICGEVASFYASQSMQVYSRQPAEGRPSARQRAAAMSAEKEQAAIRAQQDVAQKQQADATARAGLASEADRKAYDTCMIFQGNGEQCAIEARRVAAQQAEQAVQKQQSEIAKAKFAECSQTDAYKLADATNSVAGFNAFINLAREKLEHDKAIERTSGVVDLNLRQSAGEVLVSMPPMRDEAFAKYTQLGGTARSPDAVEQVQSPCVNPDAR